MINIVTLKLRGLAVFGLGLIIFNAGVIAARAQNADSGPTTTSSSVAPIGPGDPLSLTVIGQDDISKTYTVDPDGYIEILYLGKVKVEGLSPDDAQSLIQQKLSAIYTDPQVILTRTALGGITVTVAGAVGRQGTMTVRRDSTLNVVIQQCGPTTDADLKHIEITHGAPGQRHTTDTVDLSSYLDSNIPDGNPLVQDSDQIFVPKSTPVTHSVSVTGEVAHPGRYEVSPGETAFDLISQAGGLVPDADPTATYIQAEGTTDQTPFNYTTAAQNPSNTGLNPILKDGDQIVVPLAQTIATYSITGAVLKPGQYPIKGQVSLLQAIDLAGGLADHAKARATKITRQTGNGPIIINCNAFDTKAISLVYLQTGDTIQIPMGKPSQQLDPLGALETVLGLSTIFR